MRYFAAAREATGTAAERLPWTGGAPVERLREEVLRRHPRLEALGGGLRVAVNERFAAPGDPVPAGAVVAFIPPVSGG